MLPLLGFQKFVSVNKVNSYLHPRLHDSRSSPVDKTLTLMLFLLRSLLPRLFLGVLGGGDISYMVSRQICLCSFHLSLWVRGTCHDLCRWCLCKTLTQQTPWDQSDCHLWTGGQEEECLLLKPVLILFPGREGVCCLDFIPTQGFMALVLHPLSSQAPNRPLSCGQRGGWWVPSCPFYIFSLP